MRVIEDDDDYEYSEGELKQLRRIQEIFDDPTIEAVEELVALSKSKMGMVSLAACKAILELAWGPPPDADAMDE